MARRNDHSREELFELVIDGARHLVDTMGPGGVTARRIADHIGYTPGTLYQYFGSLNEIFLHVNAVNLSRLETQLQAAAQSAESPRQALLEMGYTYLNYAATHPHRFALMFTSLVPHGEDAPPHLQVRVDALFALVTGQMQQIWPESDHATLELRARALWGGVHGVVSLSMRDQLFTRSWQADRRMLRELMERFLA